MNALAPVGVTMSSREIADLVESRHDNVKTTIERLVARGVIASPAMQEKPTAGRPVIEYLIGKRDSFVIVAQLSPEFTARLVDRWQELEARAAQPAVNLSDPAFLRAALLQYTEKTIALEQAVAAAAPKVQALDRLARADGSMCITNAAKALQVQPKALFERMSADQWIYRRPGSAEWTAYQDKLQRGLLEHKITTVNRTDGSEKVTSRVLVTARGLTALAQKMGH